MERERPVAHGAHSLSGARAEPNGDGRMNPRLLIASIGTPAVSGLPNLLTAEGYHVDVADGGRTLLLLAGLHDYNAVILQTTAPAQDGVDAVRQLRRKRIAAPILILSAPGSVADRVNALDAGADDFLSLPFSATELLARVRAVLRRPRPPAPATLRVADLELDLVARKALRGTERIHLTRREFALLELLMSASPAPVSREAILERVWKNRPPPRSNVVNVLLNTIRRKIHRKDRPPLLHTVRGVGFSCRSLL